LISGPRERRRRETLGSTAASILLHAIVLALLFSFVRALVFTPAGGGEHVSETTTLSLEHEIKPKTKPHHKTHRTPKTVLPPPPAMHELAREDPTSPVSQPPPQHIVTHKLGSVAISRLVRDRNAYATEVAQLNQGNDVHAIPTIDPAARGSSTKSYAFQFGAASGEDHGNGIITPVRSWQDRGKDCYFARYEYTYPSGAMEDGSIVWPICYDPSADPFHSPPHPMAFPLPAIGYVLPPGTDLPPLEKDAYDQYQAEMAH
jgi:hypothetical protein